MIRFAGRAIGTTAIVLGAALVACGAFKGEDEAASETDAGVATAADGAPGSDGSLGGADAASADPPCQGFGFDETFDETNPLGAWSTFTYGAPPKEAQFTVTPHAGGTAERLALTQANGDWAYALWKQDLGKRTCRLTVGFDVLLESAPTDPTTILQLLALYFYVDGQVMTQIGIGAAPSAGGVTLQVFENAFNSAQDQTVTLGTGALQVNAWQHVSLVVPSSGGGLVASVDGKPVALAKPATLPRNGIVDLRIGAAFVRSWIGAMQLDNVSLR